MSEQINSRYKAKEIFETPQFAIHTSRYIIEAPIIMHDHDFFEVVFVTGGVGSHLSARGEQNAQYGDGWILAPGAWHAYRDCQHLEVSNCCFGGELLERELTALRRDAHTNHLFFQGPLALEKRGVIAFHCEKSNLDRIDEYWHALHQTSSPLERTARLLLFLGEVSKNFELSHRTSGEKTKHPAALRAMEIMENEPQKAWTLDMLAHELHLAAGYLARVFKEATGLPPIVWLHRLRAERAAQLLLQTELNVAEIGVMVGWDDPNLFARRFRSVFGVSASAYRASFRGGNDS